VHRLRDVDHVPQEELRRHNLHHAGSHHVTTRENSPRNRSTDRRAGSNSQERMKANVARTVALIV
jgi:hypothetical protein